MGIRGIPARHGGFETFAEHLALHLLEQGWEVTAYCQEAGRGQVSEREWRGVRCVHVPVRHTGHGGTMIFDLRAILHSLGRGGLILTLGYNTAVFNLLHRLFGRKNIMNMDGLEWKRGKWGIPARGWLRLNERLGCAIANHVIADHPGIAERLRTLTDPGKVTMIPYGADEIRHADAALLHQFRVLPGAYSIIVARPEPENSILEMIRAFSRKRRCHTLLVLGAYDAERNSYHRAVVRAASAEVAFPGAVYAREQLDALRHHARCYLHGHQVGGTNPSLVEALGAGNAVIAHDNPFNRWVAGKAGAYFRDQAACEELLDCLLGDDGLLAEMRNQARQRFNESFRWPTVLAQYEQLLTAWAQSDARECA